jgi:hypothetical protein
VKKYIIVVLVLLVAAFCGYVLYQRYNNIELSQSIDTNLLVKAEQEKTSHNLTRLKESGLILFVPTQKPKIAERKAKQIAKEYFKSLGEPINAEYWYILKDKKLTPTWIISFKDLSIPRHSPNYEVCKTCHPTFPPPIKKPLTELNVLVNANTGEIQGNFRYR